MTELFSNLTYVDLIGSTGTLIVVSAYFATQTRLLNSDDLAFPLINLVGSFLISFSLYFNFNLASALMEFFWIAISGVGIWKGFKERRRATAT
ncbi:hypothetical protein EBE87_28365 [Pseudoroseomonas wenyumeiae]|uniref:CBU-0592-like domain-containing protein n=1 Tax=Teichococcus wenyumeiae TaxID=2478470 RepID=A0A3A9J3U5_9PROT|nr:hypothetical protein [Pseudoroseomonas wenyumeiae]RKJ97599.1 hypothetical protein D6Z83_28245 [Pseudoroseomonas wenyumeiae]RMI13436.1 hypothetical protein EBE87_28365 [Pseudoroseomonas wenyumeiae]